MQGFHSVPASVAVAVAVSVDTYRHLPNHPSRPFSININLGSRFSPVATHLYLTFNLAS